MLAAIDPHQLSVSYVVSDDCFNYIMKRLQLVKHLEVIGVNNLSFLSFLRKLIECSFIFVMNSLK